MRNIDWTQLVHQGILHTKMIIVDQRHAYIGSANMGMLISLVATSLMQILILAFFSVTQV